LLIIPHKAEYRLQVDKKDSPRVAKSHFNYSPVMKSREDVKKVSKKPQDKILNQFLRA